MADPKEEKGTEKDEQAKAAAAAKAAPVEDKKPSAAAIAEAISGLSFRTSKGLPVLDDSTGKPVTEGGKPKMRYVPDIRPMRASDVLSAAYDGQAIVIVAKDGSKHRVGKK